MPSRGFPPLLAALLLTTSPGYAQDPGGSSSPAIEPILLQTVLDGTPLGDSLLAFPAGKSALVPLGELCRLLNFGITVQPGGRMASGFFITERRRFSLDLEHRIVKVEGHTLPLAQDQVRALGGEIFVQAQLLEVWFPMKVEVSLRDASLAILAQEKLPIQMARETESGLNWPGQGRARAGPETPFLDVPYSALNIPMVDLNLDWTATEHIANPGPTGSLSLTGDALWMTNETVFSRAQTTPYVQETTNTAQINAEPPTPSGRAVTTLQRTTFFRQDPNGNLLGPLRARTFMFGDILQAPVLNVAGPLAPGRGGLLDNYPTDFRTTFGHRRFQGPLPSGWYVELYQNGALLGTARSRPDGLYDFPDTSMMFGLNLFKLVFHGPLGELREETRRLDIADDQPPPGVLYYRAALLRPSSAELALGALSSDAGTGGTYSMESEFGLTRSLAITGALSQVSRPPSIGNQEYHEVGLRGVFPYLAIEQYGSQDQPLAGGQGRMGTAEQTTLRTGYGYSTLTLSHGEFRNGFLMTTGDGSGGTEGLFRSNSALTLNHAFSLATVPCSLSWSRTLEEIIGQGLTVDDSLTFSANWTVWNLTSVLSREKEAQQAGGPVPVQEELTATHSDARGTLQAELGYTFLPGANAISLWQLTREFQIRSGATCRLGVTGTDTTLRNISVEASLNQMVGRFSYGVDLQYSSAAGYSVSLTLSTSLAREPRSGHWVADAQSMSGSGAVSAQAFVDSNGNGRRDPGEHVEQDVRYQVGGGEAQNRSTDPRTAFYLNVGSAQEQVVRLDPGSLEAMSQIPAAPGIRFIPRPGKVALLDFSVITLGEITSTTRLRRNGKVEPLGGVEVELLDDHGNRVKMLRSAFDGFFDLPNLPLGEYTLQVTTQEAERLHLHPIPSRKIHIDAVKPTQDGMDLILDAPDQDE